MTDISFIMDSSGSFGQNAEVGRIEEHRAKRLKIRLAGDFVRNTVKYYTLSFEPYSLSRKIITENIYVQATSLGDMFFAEGYIYCPIYDYIASSPSVRVQVDAYETDDLGNVTTILKSGIFTLEFGESLTGEGVMLETTRPDVKFYENVQKIVDEVLDTHEFDGARLKRYSVGSNKIVLGSILTPHLADRSVTSEKIGKDEVVEYNLADESVTSVKIKNASVTGEKLADKAVTTDKIADKNVTNAKIADAAVTNTKLSSYCVNEAKLRPNSVSTSKIVDGAVTPAKLDRTYITHHQSLEGYATQDWVNKKNFVTDISMKADKDELPVRLSELENDIAVSFVSQKLTDSQKNTALSNIGAVKAENGKTLSSNDFTDEDKAKLESAITEHQDISMKADKEDLPEKLSELENDMAVAFTEQELTDEQKNTALKNIGAVKAEEGKTLSSNDFTDEDKARLESAITEHQDISMKADKEDLPEKLSELENDMAVAFTEQELTDEQKNTVLKNIGAVKAEEGKTLSANDFTDEDKARLESAITEHQDISMKADKEELSAVAFSGSFNDLANLPDFEELKNGFNDELKAQYDSAYAHSLSEHAPLNAQENVIEKIIHNGREAEITNKTVSLSVPEYMVYGPVFVEV